MSLGVVKLDKHSHICPNTLFGIIASTRPLNEVHSSCKYERSG
jgi:hypothetical protein